MMNRHFQRHLRLAPIALAAALVFGNGSAVHAQGSCWAQVSDCFVRAAAESSYWRSVVGSFVCEGEFLNCVRRELIGR
jgi:hypothetical protein